MSRNNTGNPIGSKAFPDFEDNVKNLDEAVNAEQDTFQDRLGKSRLTWTGMENQFDADQAERVAEFSADQTSREQEFDADQSSREQEFRTFIASSGYQFAGEYAAGIEITQYNQIIRDSNGEFWRVSGQVDLPYVTTGAGVPEDDALVPAGDAVLRQDLANPDKGAAMVARGVVAVDSIADLLALPEGQRKEGLRYLVKGYHAGSDVGGGEFSWRESSVAGSNGVLIFGNSNRGRFHRIVRDGILTPEMGGVVPGEASSVARFQSVANLCHDGDTLIFELHASPGSIYNIDSDLNLRRIACDIKGTINITSSAAKVIMGGRAQNPNNPTQKINHVSRSVSRDNNVPDVRIIGAKGQHIWIERAVVVQVWASSSNENLDGSSAYSSFWLKQITTLNLDTDPDTTGSGQQWINENNFYTDRITNVNIRGSYSHNNNKFHGGSYEGGGSVINIETGNSNEFLGVRNEGGGSIIFGEGTWNNMVLQSWSVNFNANEEYNFIKSVTNLGRPSNRVGRTHEQLLESVTVYSEGIFTSRVNTQTRTFGAPLTGANVNLESFMASRPFEGYANSDFFEVHFGDVITVSADATGSRFAFLFFDELLRPVAIVPGSISGPASGSYTDNAYTLAAVDSRGGDIEIRARTGFKYCSVVIYAGSNVKMNTKVFRVRVKNRKGLDREIVPLPGRLSVSSLPSQGFAKVGTRYFNTGTGEIITSSLNVDTLVVSASGDLVSISSPGIPGTSRPSDILPGDIVGVALDSGGTHWTTVGSISGNDITLNDAIPSVVSGGRRVVVSRFVGAE